MTVYIDLLFLVNWVLNFLMLVSAALLSRVRLRRGRVVAGAGLGALYSVLMFFPALSFLFALGARLLMGALMTLVALPPRSLLGYIKSLLWFYLTLGLFGGGMYLFYTFTPAGTQMVCSNGIYYVDLPLWLLITLGFVFYGLVRASAFLSHSSPSTQSYVDIEIALGEHYINVVALLDSGNTLTDPLTGAPVVVVEAAALCPPLSASLVTDLRQKDVGQVLLTEHKFSLRPLPVQGVTGSELLVALRPDFVRQLPNGKMNDNLLLALTPERLDAKGEYHALVPKDLL